MTKTKISAICLSTLLVAALPMHARTTNFENWKYYGFGGAYLQPNTFQLQLGNP